MRRLLVVLAWGILAISSSARLPPSAPSLPKDKQSVVPPDAETIQNFLPVALQLSWKNRRWQIMDGNVVIKDFGLREREAREALQMIQELGLNQHGTIGSPNPVMEYWLINGNAPQWMPRGSLRVQPLDPARLHIEEVQGQWCLRDSIRTLFSFGGQVDEARRALAVIQKYQFTQVGSVGSVTPSMYIFFARLDLHLPGTPNALTSKVIPAHLATTDSSHAAKNPDVPTRLTLTRQANPIWREQLHLGPLPTAKPTTGADRVRFDWRQAQLRLDRGEWKLTTGSLVLGSFGPNVQDARSALSAMRYYRFNEQCRPGGDAKLPRYFLASQQSPRGLMLGLNGRSFKPEQVEVRHLESGYVVTDGQTVLLEFGQHKQEAEQLAEAIRNDKFDEICTLGHEGKEAMTILVRSR